MTKSECPQCGGGLRLEVRGDLLDKIMTCSHCGYELDVLDEVTIEGDGVTIHRKDLGGQQAMAAMDDLFPDLESTLDTDIAAQVKERLAQGQASGKVVTHTSRTTTVHRGDDAVTTMKGKGLDLNAVVAESLNHAHQSATDAQPQPASALKALFLFLAVVFLLTGAVVAVLFLV